MGLENRKPRIEKSDLDSFEENRWNNTTNLKDYLDLCDEEETIFNEQEAGKATVYSLVQDKEAAKHETETMEEETERYEAELKGRSSELLSRIEDLFDR